MTALQTGQVIGREFRLERPLGKGGMGVVWLATQLTTGRSRALKLIDPALGLDVRACERFIAEARVGARIPSDHVVEVVGSGRDADTGMPWLAMELLEGEDLDQTIRRRGALPREEVATLLEQVGHGLAAAHQQGIVHRDLKPENVFLTTPRRVGASMMVKLLDFGIAAILPDDRSKATVTSAMGTPLWWAPEQMQVGQHIRPATDVWPLGLLAFHALTGHYYWRTPYGSDASVARIVTEILVEPLGPASVRARELKVDDALPRGFDDWFGSAVVRDPHARFRDAGAAVAALLPLLRAKRPQLASVAFAATAPSGMPLVEREPPVERVVERAQPPVERAVERPPARNPEAPPPIVRARETIPETPPEARVAPTVWVLALGGVLALAVLGVLGLVAWRTASITPPPPATMASATAEATPDAAVALPSAEPTTTTDAGASALEAVAVAPDLAGHAASRRSIVAAATVPAAADPVGSPWTSAPVPSSDPPAPAIVAPPEAPLIAAPSPPPPTARPSAVVLERSAPSRQVGNTEGGDPYDDACGAGEAMVALEGNSVPYVGRIRVVCGRLTLPEGAGRVRVGSTRALATRGHLGGEPSRASCGDDEVVVGFEARAGALVDRIALRCAPLSVDGSGAIVVGAATSGGSIGGSGGNPVGTTSCPSGGVARGARIRAGDGLDAFGLACGAPSAR